MNNSKKYTDNYQALAGSYSSSAARLVLVLHLLAFIVMTLILK